MSTKQFIVIALVLFPGTLVAGASIGFSRYLSHPCPLVFAKNASECAGAANSTCWWPLGKDTDCRTPRGYTDYCCFDGCSNHCGIPDNAAAISQAPRENCVVMYVSKFEDVLTKKCSRGLCKVYNVHRRVYEHNFEIVYWMLNTLRACVIKCMMLWFL